MENKTKILKKLSDIAAESAKINKDKTGYNFKYNDPEKINEEMKTLLIKHGVWHSHSIRIPKHDFEPNPIKTSTIKSVTKSQKEKTEFISELIIEHTYTCLDTGESVTYVSKGSGIADQPGQADGAALSYSTRVEFEKRFKLNVKYKEDLTIELKFSPDAEGEPSEILKTDSMKALKAAIFSGCTEQKEALDVNAKVIKQINEKLGTNYKKLTLIPEKYKEDLIKIISMIKNA